DIERLAFNTAISEMMKFANAASASAAPMNRSQAEKFLLVLSPFAPHIAEEIWSRMGHQASIANEGWPSYDPEKIKEDVVEIPVQVNGRVRSRVSVRADASEDEMRKAAEEAAAQWLKGKQIVRAVVVPGRLVNIVVR
ncbi:MAG: class I tRNA ligase family protein, partial [Planctomycetota bacterium]|nr:class I tRNA ligase family protein [Planctomycetota bacterium]